MCGRPQPPHVGDDGTRETIPDKEAALVLLHALLEKEPYIPKVLRPADRPLAVMAGADSELVVAAPPIPVKPLADECRGKDSAESEELRGGERPIARLHRGQRTAYRQRTVLVPPPKMSRSDFCTSPCGTTHSVAASAFALSLSSLPARRSGGILTTR